MAQSPFSDRNYYRVLGVLPSATQEEIKIAYRSLAKKWHPDLYFNNPLYPLAAEKMTTINDAYRVLSNPALRASYDAQLREEAPSHERTRAEEEYIIAQGYINEGNVPAAVEALKRALFLEAEFLDARKLLVFILIETKDYVGADEHVRAMWSLDDPDVLMFAGVLCSAWREPDWEGAIRCFRRCCEVLPDDPVPQVALANAYLQAGRLRSALHSLRQAGERFPADARVQALLGYLYALGRDFVSAQECTRRAVELDPESGEVGDLLGAVFGLTVEAAYDRLPRYSDQRRAASPTSKAFQFGCGLLAAVLAVVVLLLLGGAAVLSYLLGRWVRL